jgi:hypothetical protein
MHPHLSPSGFATVYLILPPGSFAREHQHAIDTLKKKPRRFDRFQGIVSEEPEILYLLGQARFAARVEAIDYRSVLDRAYPDPRSKALVSNAVFSIPYETAPGAVFTHSRKDPGMLRFLTHLRVRRTIYKRDPVLAETLIIERLREISKELDGEFTIEAGLGWADFIVSGVIHPDKFNDFLKNLVEFNRVCVDHRAIDDRSSVFRRSLTLVGYPWTGAGNAPRVIDNPKALMFIRARPGHLSEVEALMTTQFDKPAVEFVDGKIDVIVSMQPPAKANFFQQHEELSEETGPGSIEKIETHIVFGSHLFERDSENNERHAESVDCGCATVERPYCEIDVLPETLRNAVRNMGFLFEATLRDPANCCDARNAILASEASLKTLIIQLYRERLDARLPGPPSAVRASDEVSVRILRRIDRWVRTAERILRQRTVGSFEEFLGQSDRAVSYRGGAQKVLTVADNLMNDFYAKIRKRPWEASLTALYDSADGVEIVVGTGFVRLPVRALFFLPGVVPDLWHEVGSFHFFKEFDVVEGLHLNLDDPVERALHTDLADHYGDLISFIYGFELDRQQFVSALLEGWLASQAHKEVPQSVMEESYEHILIRMVAVLEFLLTNGKQVTLPDDVADDVRNAQEVRRRGFLFACCREVFRIVKAYNTKRIPRITRRTINHILTVLRAPRLMQGLDFIRTAIRMSDVKTPPPINDSNLEFGKPAPLRSFNVRSDLNHEFRDVYWAVIQHRITTGKRPNAFAFTAALTRGAALEYHRRTAVRDENRLRARRR